MTVMVISPCSRPPGPCTPEAGVEVEEMEMVLTELGAHAEELPRLAIKRRAWGGGNLGGIKCHLLVSEVTN
jgi:hypothetical protein